MDTISSPAPVQPDHKPLNFFDLLDLNFTRFITVQLVKVIYVIGLALIAIVAMAMIITGFKNGIVMGIGALLLAPVIVALWVLGLRVYLELIVALFRIAQNTSIMAERLQKP